MNWQDEQKKVATGVTGGHDEFNCVCGDLTALGVVHRKDGPCYYPDKREWVGLNWNDLPEIYVGDTAFLHGAKWAEAKLKEKNT